MCERDIRTERPESGYRSSGCFRLILAINRRTMEVHPAGAYRRDVVAGKRIPFEDFLQGFS